jgi:glycerol-3-phosphate dehydrogenase (NAD(P)+)
VSGAVPPIAVLGAGSWGTALTIHLERLGARPRLWGRDPVLVKEIRETRENRRYLPGIAVPPGALATSDAEEALAGAGIVIAAVPSHFIETALASTKGGMPPGATVVSATKGLEPRRGRRISVLLGELLP